MWHLTACSSYALQGTWYFTALEIRGERKRVNIQCLVERKPLVLIDASS